MLQSQMSPKVLSILTDTAEQRAETLKTSQSAGISYRRLIARCHCYSQLLNIFAFLLAQKDSGDEIVVEDTLRDRESDVADLLQLEMSELTRLLVDTEMNLTAKPKAKASGNDQLLNVSQFIRLFDISRIIASMNMAEADSDSNQNFDRENMPFSKLFLKNDLTNHEKQLLGEFIFKPFMTGADLNSLPAQLKAQLTLEEEEIFQLFCHAWLDKQHNYSVYPQKLYFLILQMVESFSPQANSKWLQTLESAIIDCSNLAEALMLAIIVRPVSSISHKSKMEVEEEFGSGAESFEQLKPSLERWDSLLKVSGKLVDYLMLE